jgi:uncharacterized protein YdiU (UPF0061 family)
MDELIGASILAEKIHQQGVSTERVLCIIDLGKGYGIGVRAAHNLIRPAHLFLYLKQERFENLKASTDYLIQRQVENKAWNIDLNSKNKYDQFLKIICHTFAKFSAMLEVDYIFAWLDWDGDNVLADGGIIDYGSIRQFGLCHDKYRYDDVERFSTNLTEQKKKARLIIQVFAQLVDYLKTGHKKPLQKFNHHTIIKRFNLQFEQHRNLRLLYRMGFDENQRLRILKKKDLFNKFKKEYLYFEKAKITGTEENVPDGINHAALFNMRKVLRKYPQFLKMNFKSFQKASMPEKNFYKMMLSSYATASDLQMNEIHEKHIKTFQKLYKELLLTAAGKKPLDSIIAEICQRSEILNSAKRITGNALIEIVDEILTHKQQGLPLEQIQNTIDQLINDGLNSPEIIISQFTKAMQRPRFIKTDLLAKLMTLIEQHNESI